jgi:hypothetical protein
MFEFATACPTFLMLLYAGALLMSGVPQWWLNPVFIPSNDASHDK